MNKFVRTFRKDEQGVTALETAIILIAFVVVASVFAFTILSSGTTTTQAAKESITSGLAEVQGTMQIKGSIVALESETVSDTVGSLVFTVATATGGDPVNLTEPPSNTLIIDYRDEVTRTSDISWTVEFQGTDDGDDLLEDREQAQLTVTVPTGVDLGANEAFAIELKPPTGATMLIERTIPADVDAVMDLN